MNMNIVRCNPFNEHGQELDRNFLSMLDALRQRSESASDEDWKPLVDIHETDDGYRLDVELPAVNPRDVRVELHKGVLNISGERHCASPVDRMHQREQRYGKFWRGFHLPDDADASAIHATAKDGVVSITVGKSGDSQPRAIAVELA